MKKIPDYIDNLVRISETILQDVQKKTGEVDLGLCKLDSFPIKILYHPNLY